MIVIDALAWASAHWPYVVAGTLVWTAGACLLAWGLGQAIRIAELDDAGRHLTAVDQ